MGAGIGTTGKGGVAQDKQEGRARLWPRAGKAQRVCARPVREQGVIEKGTRWAEMVAAAGSEGRTS